MKKWGLVVAGIYGLIVFAALSPVAKISFFGTETWKGISWFPDFTISDWPYWFGIPMLFIIAQAVFLAVPVSLAEGRPVGKRSIWSTIIASALMLGLLAGSIMFALLEVIRGDKTNDIAAHIFEWGAVAIFILSWVFWAFVFYRWSKQAEPTGLVEKLRDCLFKGSILELLVALPMHIVVRQREYCCAGIYTFFGIACGLAVMLFSFGPGLFFLFVERWKRLHPQTVRQ